MGLGWPPSQGVPQTTAPARAALAGAAEELAAATAALRSAGDVEWVSAAASAYQELLGDALGALAGLDVALDRAYWSVVRHTQASDDARAAQAARAVVDPLVLPVWRPALVPPGRA